MENILFQIAIKRNTKINVLSRSMTQLPDNFTDKINVGNKPPTYIIVLLLVSPLKLNPVTNNFNLNVSEFSF